MSLDTILNQLGLRQPDPHSLETQIRDMRREVQRLGRSLSSYAGPRLDEWMEQAGDFGNDAARQTARLALIAGRKAHSGLDQVRRDPMPVIAVIATGLLIARLIRRR